MYNRLSFLKKVSDYFNTFRYLPPKWGWLGLSKKNNWRNKSGKLSPRDGEKQKIVIDNICMKAQFSVHYLGFKLISGSLWGSLRVMPEG